MININYAGGSGGFLALWVVLLGSKYRCVFKSDTQDLNEIKHKQWNIEDTSKWKSSEIWPDNELTELSDIDNKVFFYCDPTDKEWNNQKGLKIILYADIKLQLALAEYKNAFLYVDNESLNSVVDPVIIKNYNNVKDKSWPDVTMLDELRQCPEHILTELKEEFNIDVFADSVDFFDTTMWNGSKVWSDIGKMLPDADVTVRLVDLIQTNGSILLDKIGGQRNKDVDAFIQHWLSLHPEGFFDE